MQLARFIVSVLLTALLACATGDATAPTPGPLDGDWTGIGGGVTLAVRLDQRDSTVRGSGTLSSANTSIPVTVRGTFVDPNVSLKITASGFKNLNYTGSLIDANTIDGKLNGSGFPPDFPLTLNRH